MCLLCMCVCIHKIVFPFLKTWILKNLCEGQKRQYSIVFKFTGFGSKHVMKSEPLTGSVNLEQIIQFLRVSVSASVK